MDLSERGQDLSPERAQVFDLIRGGFQNDDRERQPREILLMNQIRIDRNKNVATSR